MRTLTCVAPRKKEARGRSRGSEGEGVRDATRPRALVELSLTNLRRNEIPFGSRFIWI
jgi:hypothetical protein